MIYLAVVFTLRHLLMGTGSTALEALCGSAVNNFPIKIFFYSSAVLYELSQALVTDLYINGSQPWHLEYPCPTQFLRSNTHSSAQDGLLVKLFDRFHQVC